MCAAKDAAGPILVTVLGMVAEMERKFIRERQQAGIEAVRVSTRGVSRLCRSKVRDMRASGHGSTAIAKALGISRMSVHRILTGA